MISLFQILNMPINLCNYLPGNDIEPLGAVRMVMFGICFVRLKP